MTQEETLEAVDIVRAYDYLNKELQLALDSLVEIEKRKDDLMSRLEELKTRENDFMERYKEKYGDRDILSELNMVNQ